MYTLLTNEVQEMESAPFIEEIWGGNLGFYILEIYFHFVYPSLHGKKAFKQSLSCRRDRL